MKPTFSPLISANWLSLSFPTSISSSRYSPVEGISKHPSIFIIVDLPDPEGPIIEANSPCSISRFTDFTALTCTPDN